MIFPQTTIFLESFLLSIPKVFTQQETEWFVYKPDLSFQKTDLSFYKPDLSFQKTGGKAENYFAEKRKTENKKWIVRILIRQ